MQDNFDLSSLLKTNVNSNDESFKEFFSSRGISQNKLAETIGISVFIMHCWLNNKIKIPEKRIRQLEELKNMIIKWEEENGKKFNS
jgi:ribosome-binding protein aMBF1 (putative translation factor)